MSELAAMSAAEIEVEEAQLAVQRQRAVCEKTALETELASLNSQIATRVATGVYQRIRSQRVQVIRQLNEKVAEIAEFKGRFAALWAVKQVKKDESGVLGKDDRLALRLIRDKWQGYSMDDANPSACRKLAWKFAEEINGIIKKYFVPQ